MKNKFMVTETSFFYPVITNILEKDHLLIYFLEKSL